MSYHGVSRKLHRLGWGGSQYGLKLLNQHKATNWITDTTNGFKNDEADSKWLIEEFIPQTIDSYCKNIIFIMRDNSPLKDEI